MIEVRGLAKRYGDILAVDDLSFDVEPGKVTGFLGPNGAGKSTTMRIMLGLDRPTAGTALVGGLPFATYAEPLRVELGDLPSLLVGHLPHLRLGDAQLGEGPHDPLAGRGD